MVLGQAADFASYWQAHLIFWRMESSAGACSLPGSTFFPVAVPYFAWLAVSKGNEASRKYENAETKRVAWFFDPTPFTSIIEKEQLLPTKKMSFNGLMMRFPGGVESYLAKRYGDYMQLPPEDKRHNHPPYELDFGDER